MAAVVNTYTGLQAAVAEWMARAGDTDITGRFDDYLALVENRLWYGSAQMGAFPECEPLRIREMETVSAAFSLSSATVAQPSGFLELISAKLNSPERPMDIVHEGVIDGYRDQSLGGTYLIAVSGTNFRFFDAPTSGTATLRYFAKLTTPTAGNSNWVLTNAPNVYLDGCLFEAAKMTGDADAAAMYLVGYASAVRGLNQRRNSELKAATNVRMRLRGRTP